MVTAMMTQPSALCANWSINRLHHTSAFPPYGVLVIRPFESLLRRWLRTSKWIKLFQLFKYFLQIHFSWAPLKKNSSYMENNFEDDNAIVYAWINLSVGKKQKCTRGSEGECKSYGDTFVREIPNLLNMSVNSRTGMKSLSLFFPFYFSPYILKLTNQGLKHFWALGKKKKREKKKRG